MPDHSFSKEIFPNIQSKPPLTQLEVAAPHCGEAVAAQLKEHQKVRRYTAFALGAASTIHLLPPPG